MILKELITICNGSDVLGITAKRENGYTYWMILDGTQSYYDTYIDRLFLSHKAPEINSGALKLRVDEAHKSFLERNSQFSPTP